MFGQRLDVGIEFRMGSSQRRTQEQKMGETQAF